MQFDTTQTTLPVERNRWPGKPQRRAAAWYPWWFGPMMTATYATPYDQIHIQHNIERIPQQSYIHQPKYRHNKVVLQTKHISRLNHFWHFYLRVLRLAGYLSWWAYCIMTMIPPRSLTSKQLLNLEMQMKLEVFLHLPKLGNWQTFPVFSLRIKPFYPTTTLFQKGEVPTRLRIRPEGVVSKNDMGARKTRWSISK